MTATIPATAVGMKVGSKAQAVRPVQSYLEKFGYLESADHPFEVDDVHFRSGAPDHLLQEPLASLSGVFDEPAVEALRRFQRFASLEPTGVLDDATREKMNLSRCGNPDTTPSVETAALADFVTGAGKWSTNDLTYSFQDYTGSTPEHSALGD